MSLHDRVARLERAGAARGGQCIIVRGGLPDADPFDCATILGDTKRRAEGETVADFRSRMEGEAARVRAPFVIFGGLPE